MIIVLIFLFIVISSLMVWHYMIIPLASFNTESINKIDTQVHNISTTDINSDFWNNLNKNQSTQINWTKKNIILNTWASINDSEKNSLWLLSKIKQWNIKTNNILTDKIINLNNFWLELQLIPLSDIPNFTIYTTDTVKSIIVNTKIYKIWSDINSVKQTNWQMSIDNSSIWTISLVWNQPWINWTVVSSNEAWSNKYINIQDLSAWSTYYYKDKWLFFNKKIIIKPFYNIDNNWDVINQSNSPYFKQWYMYLIKIYFNLNQNRINNFRLYIPNWRYITLNNIEKVVTVKEWKTFLINKVKIIKNWLINKVWDSKYWF